MTASPVSTEARVARARPSLAQQPADDRHHLLRRLALAENHLRHPGARRAAVIQHGEVRRPAGLTRPLRHRLSDGQPAFLHGGQQFRKLSSFHRHPTTFASLCPSRQARIVVLTTRRAPATQATRTPRRDHAGRILRLCESHPPVPNRDRSAWRTIPHRGHRQPAVTRWRPPQVPSLPTSLRARLSTERP